MPTECQIERQRIDDDLIRPCGAPLFSPELIKVGVCASCIQNWSNPHSRITDKGKAQVEEARQNYEGPGVFAAYDLIEKDGKTWRQKNLEKTHKFALGDVVEVDLEIWRPSTEKRPDGEPVVEVNLKGTCRLYVVLNLRDCDGTPLYGISDIPVRWPHDPDGEPIPMFTHDKLMYETVAKVFEHGYSEDSLRPTGERAERMYDSVREMFGGG